MALSTIQHLTPATQAAGSFNTALLRDLPRKGGAVDAFCKGVGMVAAPLLTVGAVGGDLLASPLRALAGTSVFRDQHLSEHFLERGALGWAADRMPRAGRTSGAVIGRACGNAVSALAWCFKISNEGRVERAAATGSRMGAAVGRFARSATELLGGIAATGAHVFSGVVTVGFASMLGLGTGILVTSGLAMLLLHQTNMQPNTFSENWFSAPPAGARGARDVDFDAPYEDSSSPMPSCRTWLPRDVEPNAA